MASLEPTKPAPIDANRNRETAWDYARGIGIILVVYGHVLRGLNTAGMVPDGHWLMGSDYVIYIFHMPLFFLLAGANAGRGLARHGFLKNKLLSIVYPYLLWSLLQGLVQVSVSGSANIPFHLSDLPAAIFWKPLGQFWFLYALLLCHVYAYFTKAHRVRVIMFALAAYMLGTIFEIGILSQSFQYFLFYAAGLLAAEYLGSITRRMANPVAIPLVFFAAAIAIAAAAGHGAYADPWALPAAFLSMFLVLQIAMLLAGSHRLQFLERLGLASMPIYLMHILAASGARMLLAKLGMTDKYLHLGIGVSCGVLFPLAVYHVVWRAGKEKLLGFASGDAVFVKPRLCFAGPELPPGPRRRH